MTRYAFTLVLLGWICLPAFAASPDSGAALIQCRLTLAGYDPGTIDGVYGQKTKAAAHQFSKDQGKTPEQPVFMTREEVQQLTDRPGKDIEGQRPQGQIRGGREVPWSFWFTNALIERTQAQLYKCKDVLQAIYWRSK
jgi:peptidoglycan hydrolase-like protein with peptidoglycan-binding domain